MKKIISLSLVFVLFLSSCSIDWNGEKDNKIVELEKEVTLLKKNKENDIFKKKQECLKYKDEMLKQLNDIGHINGAEYIDEIFYSNKNDTCFYTSNGTNSYIIYDYFNNKFFDGANYSNFEDSNRLKLKIKELKGE
ncbi:MAG: hypothetical protein PHS49_06095 [Candidatus Gracilibacteria bacterium]|nr:hypothetical protein [Candidatus Gracilibacteria bacterium]